ncbi:peptidoglycan/xylan/chitin deacetylase (PgdA/CDA1 family) [Nocardia mexicana]|uniref:Peptidoglycan/xylan/chitin deacetylase (PgdA/CDA1 family) n=2 Tax=Nocardia mexicana TaxID=279262 RepID=A0A370H4Z9_9NOCA|nr:peptidoglycan/xylan/chitin deacetylase (PgdA/CDA1 family) [Nocardia mexicana]
MAVRNIDVMVRNRGTVLSALALLVVAACGTTQQPAAVTEPAPPPAAPAPDPAAVGANELGLVPVLMYHQLSPAPAGEYDQTPGEFRDELERLYREGYRPVTAAKYIAGEIDIPAGTHPVVLTFDDSTASQVSFAPDGTPAPDSAVGILADFAARHPDFPAVATFYVNDDLFGDDPRALPWLAAHGYDIGAHTASHANLGNLDATGVQRELALNIRTIAAAAPGAPVRTMALPLGVSPADRALAVAGSWEGTPYSFDAVMLVGSEPAPSPYGSIDPAAVPRIRSGEGQVPFDSAYWLDHLATHPDQRYTSDGDPQRIAFPRNLSADLPAKWSARAHPF